MALVVNGKAVRPSASLGKLLHGEIRIHQSVPFPGTGWCGPRLKEHPGASFSQDLSRPRGRDSGRRPVPVPTSAQAAQVAGCSENALVNAINAASTIGGDHLILSPFCTFTMATAHGTGDNGSSGLPVITTPITMTRVGTDTVRASGAADFRIGGGARSRQLPCRERSVLHRSAARRPVPR